MSNRETYKKAFEKITMPQHLEKELLKMTDKPKRTIWKPVIAMTATAAVLCALVFGGDLMTLFSNDGILPTQAANVFMLTAYAAEQQPDGTVDTQRPLELTQTDNEMLTVEFDDKGITGGSGIFSESGEYVGATLHTGVGFKVAGENIASVRLSVDEGYFTDFVIPEGEESYRFVQLGATHTMNPNELDAPFFWSFEVKGNIVRSHENGVLSITFENGEEIQAPTATINVVVTFEDGEVQEQSIMCPSIQKALVYSVYNPVLEPTPNEHIN